MSNETPGNDRLTHASRDASQTPEQPQAAQAADELETLLAAIVLHDGGDASQIATDLRDSTRVADVDVAVMLVALANSIIPDPDFAASLQLRLEQRIRERGTGGPDVGAGSNHHNGGAQYGLATRRRLTLPRYRPLWAAMAALLLLSLLLALPSVQATLRQPLCLGSVCILAGGTAHPTANSHSAPTSTPLSSVLDLAGRTTLAQARAQAGFPIRLPAYPAELGQPDDVFVQNLEGTAVVLVWVDHAHPSQPRLSLFELSSGLFVYKFATQPIAVTTVHGQQALWTTGPYQVELQNGSFDYRLLVSGHALIWTEGTITYRLETSGSLADAVRIAESMH